MIIQENFKIETERLNLVLIDLKYQDDIFREFTEEVAKYLTPKPTGNIADIVNFIESSRSETLNGKQLQMVAIEKKSGDFVACLGLHELNTKNLELGLWFKESAWGKGYGKESMLALKKWADANLDYDKIIYPVFKENLPSRKIAEFLGGKLEREFIGKNQRGEENEEVEYFIYKL